MPISQSPNNSIDPDKINPIGNPILVFVSQDNLISDLIELSEDGSWQRNGEVSHMMTMTLPGLYNCQNPSGFMQLPTISTYREKGTRLAFIAFNNMTPEAYKAMGLLVTAKLGRQKYDWLQILAQATGLDFAHMPGTEDCSEEGVREIKGIAPYLSTTDQVIIADLPNQSNPQEVFDFCLSNIWTFAPVGNCSF